MAYPVGPFVKVGGAVRHHTLAIAAVRAAPRRDELAGSGIAARADLGSGTVMIDADSVPDLVRNRAGQPELPVRSELLLVDPHLQDVVGGCHARRKDVAERVQGETRIDKL